MEGWQETFGKPPRDVQTDAYEWWLAKDEKVALVELPTGGGKSLLGSWMLHQAPGRGIYVCPTKKLQMQLATEASTWPGWDGPIVCLFGRNNYLCEKKVAKFMRESDDTRAKNILTAVRASFASNVPPYEHFCEECLQQDVSPDETEELWQHVSAQKCSCSEDTFHSMQQEGCSESEIYQAIESNGCEYEKRKCRAKGCKMLIINAALFFNLLMHTKQIDLTKDWIVIDEGHLLHEYADILFKARPRNLNMHDAMQTLSGFAASGTPVASDISGIVHSFPQQNTLTFTNPTVCDAVQRHRNHLDAGSLASVTGFLGVAFKCLLSKSRPSGVDEEHRTKRQKPGAKAEETKEDLLSSWRDKVAQGEGADKVGEPYKSVLLDLTDPDEERVCSLRNEAEVVEFLNHAPMEALRKVADTNRLISRILDVLDTRLGRNWSLQAALDELLIVHRLYKDFDTLKLASVDYRHWADQESLKDFVPTLKREPCEMVEYTPTISGVARRLKEELWDKVTTGVLVLSATMTNAQKPSDPFGLIKQQLGVTTAATKCMDQVFDRDQVEILSPYMERWNSLWGWSKKQEYRQSQADAIKSLVMEIQENKSVLVLGPTSNAEADEMWKRLRHQLPDWQHIHAKNEKRKYRAFCDDACPPRTILYGGNSESTGLNQPGKFALVVITRPPNPLCHLTREQYHKLQGNKVLYRDLYYFKRDQDAIQAAGRLQRQKTDRGRCAVLGEVSEEGTLSMFTSSVIHRAWQQTRRIHRY